MAKIFWDLKSEWARNRCVSWAPPPPPLMALSCSASSSGIWIDLNWIKPRSTSTRRSRSRERNKGCDETEEGSWGEDVNKRPQIQCFSKTLPFIHSLPPATSNTNDFPFPWILVPIQFLFFLFFKFWLPVFQIFLSVYLEILDSCSFIFALFLHFSQDFIIFFHHFWILPVYYINNAQFPSLPILFNLNLFFFCCFFTAQSTQECEILCPWRKPTPNDTVFPGEDLALQSLRRF